MSDTAANLRALRQDIYVMRNGILADSLRQSGCPYRLIFGLNLPQLTEIADRTGRRADLALELWRDTSLREAALMAPMLYPPEKLTIDFARERAAAVRWAEDADILCFKLLRHAPFAAELAEELCGADAPLSRYTGLRLLFCTVGQHPAEALKAAERELRRPEPLSTLAAMLRQEAEFLLEQAE